MARTASLMCLLAGLLALSSAATPAPREAVEPGVEAVEAQETTLDKSARAKKDAGYPYGGYGGYGGYNNYNRYNTYPTAPGYNTGFYNQDWSRSYNTGYNTGYNQYNQYDPRYSYQTGGYYPADRYNYNRGYYPGYDARTTGYGNYGYSGVGSRYPYEDRFYSNYPYNTYNRYNDYNRRAYDQYNRYDNRYQNQYYPSSGYGGYNNAPYNSGYNYNSGYGAYPNYPITQEYYYNTAAGSNQVYNAAYPNTGYGGRYLKKRDGKEPVAQDAAHGGPTPASPAA